MTTFPKAPRLLKGAIVTMNPATGAKERTITLQYNPDTLTRTLKVQGAEGEGADRSEALRLTGPPVETYKLEAEIDAADYLEEPNQHRNIVKYGIQPQLAALETLLYPQSNRMLSNNQLAAAGTMEILPMESPLTLFVWSRQRVLPVRLTEFSVTEEAFDPALNPIRAKISLGMRVLNPNDFGFEHRGGNLFITYQQQLEKLATLI